MCVTPIKVQTLLAKMYKMNMWRSQDRLGLLIVSYKLSILLNAGVNFNLLLRLETTK